MSRNSSCNKPSLPLPLVIHILGILLLWLPHLLIADQAHAVVTTSITATPDTGNLSTTITQTGNLYDITGGTRPDGGTNLFHSFQNFSVGAGDIANFLNIGSFDLNGNLLADGLPTSNILVGVTGVNISNIYGTLQTSDFGSANLFLMNPHGFLFGPNATVNVGGMVAFTTAYYLRLEGTGGNGIFHADPLKTSMLTSAPVAAFGFLGSNPGAITVQGSQFSVTPGQSISLVGGNITVQSGVLDDGITVQPARLTASGGQINLASVGSPGEILAGTLNQAPNINGQSFVALGTIHVLEQSVNDVSGNGGGTVSIRGGSFVLNNSSISANVTGPGPLTNGVESIGGGVDIQVSQDAVIQNGALIDTSVVGNATPGVTYNGVHIKADRIEVVGIADLDTGNFVPTVIQSNVAQDSTGGSSVGIKLEANSAQLKDLVFLDAKTSGSGNAGSIMLKSTGNLEADGLVFITSEATASGNAGNIGLTSTRGDILLTNAPFVTSQSLGSGTVGSIAVNAPNGDILLRGSPVFGPTVLFTHIDGTGLNEGKGGIQLTAQNLTIENSGIQIDNFSPDQPGGLRLNVTGTLKMSGGDIFNSTLLTTTRGLARSADLTITAHDTLLTDGSQVATDTFGSGKAGVLNIFTDNLQITNGAQVRSSSRFNPVNFPGDPIITPSGAGGTVAIRGLTSQAQSVFIDGIGSGIFTDTQGTGAGGNIFVNANSVTLQNSGTLSAATSGSASSSTGGTITVDAANTVTLNNASITASSMGVADAGSINITAMNGLTMQNSTIATLAGQGAGGGNIRVTTAPSATVLLQDSKISASVADGSGGGGNISIDPQFVILQNSQILAQAAQGQGGAITIIANLFLSDANSIVNADSGSGVNGTITIQSPNAPVSGQIQPLGKTPLIATTLLNQHCAALAGGQFSSFTVAGRDSLPTEPGGWLASPLAFATLSEGNGLGTKAEGMSASPGQVASGQWQVGDIQILSLRQIAPAGFLTQAFAVDRSAGCQS